jgi:hypothetical protein
MLQSVNSMLQFLCQNLWLMSSCSVGHGKLMASQLTLNCLLCTEHNSDKLCLCAQEHLECKLLTCR